MRRYAAALSGSLVAGDDLVQDCIERALRQADRLRDPQRLAAWLRSILHNLYIDELRRKRTRGIEEDITELADNVAISVAPADSEPSAARTHSGPLGHHRATRSPAAIPSPMSARATSPARSASPA